MRRFWRKTNCGSCVHWECIVQGVPPEKSSVGGLPGVGKCHKKINGKYFSSTDWQENHCPHWQGTKPME
jgi:hypothetical protein